MNIIIWPALRFERENTKSTAKQVIVTNDLMQTLKFVRNVMIYNFE